MKLLEKDGIQGLFLEDISKADILQRKGRAGRTKSGKYILCSDTPIEYRSEYSIPEIQRSILDRVVLQLAAIDLDSEELEFFHQPDKTSIKAAKKELITLGALKGNNTRGNVFKSFLVIVLSLYSLSLLTTNIS